MDRVPDFEHPRSGHKLDKELLREVIEHQRLIKEGEHHVLKRQLASSSGPLQLLCVIPEGKESRVVIQHYHLEGHLLHEETLPLHKYILATL